MRFKLSFLLLLSLIVSGCGGDKSDGSLPDMEFGGKSNYVLSDFDLNNEVRYWEIRMGPLPQSEWRDEIGYLYEYDVLYQFDETGLASLSEQEVQNLNDVDSQYGFSSECLPDYCPIYGVSVQGGSVVVIASDQELLDFFGTINTHAELDVWLWAKSYQARYYQEVEGGYMVVVAWDNLCGTSGEDLIFVDHNGVITKQREISRESYSGCV
ncbi:hypothetical protein [uncultured Thalassolituus sp.]|uniref:hypothetical protein n=1 Tax=uncultured Thalassolituus sp. TaxID=285273 RepID=UPI00262BF493|nr:hypothetical protein [uncultured Thalassolituus sp.]